MKSAIGIVIASEKTPQGDSVSALTTTRPSTAIRMIMIVMTANMAAQPPPRPSVSRAIWPRLRPPRRVEMASTM